MCSKLRDYLLKKSLERSPELNEKRQLIEFQLRILIFCWHTRIKQVHELEGKGVQFYSISIKTTAAISVYMHVQNYSFFNEITQPQPQPVEIKKGNWLNINCLYQFIVDPLGLEPRMTVPKTVVLPLHHGSKTECKIIKSNYTMQHFFLYFLFMAC